MTEQATCPALAPPRWCLVLSALTLALTLAPPAAGEAYDPGEERARRMIRIVEHDVPVLRVSFGLGFYPRLELEPRFDIDAALGGRFALYRRGGLRVELVPEFGYSYHGNIDSEVEGHYGTFAFGLRVAGRWFGGSTVSMLLLGSRLDEFDIGVRNGLRLDAFEGIAGVEVCHEWRTGEAGDIHSVRVLLTVALSPRALADAQELTLSREPPPL